MLLILKRKLQKGISSMLPFSCKKERQIRKPSYICLDLQSNNNNRKEKPENNEAGYVQGMGVGEED